MRHIKIIILSLLVIFISGCSKEYELYISDNQVIEKFHMEIESDNKYSNLLDGDFYPLHNDFDHKYEKKLKNKGNSKVLDLKYVYSSKDFVYANSFNQCFDQRQVLNDKNYYTIELAKPNSCMFNAEYTINVYSIS